MRYLSIIATDSRGKNFQELDFEQNSRNYDTVYISKSGAKIEDLIAPVIQTLEPINPNRPVVLKLVAGICNITSKNRTPQRETQITYQETINISDLISQFRHFREVVLETHPKSLVSVATIPPANLVTVNQKVRTPVYSSREILRQSRAQMKDVCELNKKIIQLNYESQELARPTTPLLSATCVKVKKGKLSPIVGALPDGIHGTKKVQEKWLSLIHRSIERDITKIRFGGKATYDQTRY